MRWFTQLTDLRSAVLVWTPSAEEGKRAVASEIQHCQVLIMGEQLHGCTYHPSPSNGTAATGHVRIQGVRDALLAVWWVWSYTGTCRLWHTDSKVLQYLEKQSLFHNHSPAPRVSLKHEMSEPCCSARCVSCTLASLRPLAGQLLGRKLSIRTLPMS